MCLSGIGTYLPRWRIPIAIWYSGFASRNRLSTSFSLLYPGARKTPPPNATVVSWMNRVYRMTGMKVVLTITPDLKMHYSIIGQDADRIDGMVVPPKNSL